MTDDSAPSPPEARDAFFSDFYRRAPCSRAGFAKAKCYGSFERDALTSETRLVIVAER